jgi:hypothetical protein
VTADELAARLAVLADRVDRLRPSNHDPEAYFIERDQIRATLKKLAADIAPSRVGVAAERGKFTAGAIRVDGVRVSVERRGHRARRGPDEIRKVFG